MKKTDKILATWKKYLVEGSAEVEAAMGGEGAQSEQQPEPENKSAPAGPPKQEAPDGGDSMVAETELMLIRDLIRALVIELPDDINIQDLVNQVQGGNINKDQSKVIKESISSIIEQSKTYNDNAKRLEIVEKLNINDNNKREIYSRLLKVINTYS